MFLSIKNSVSDSEKHNCNVAVVANLGESVVSGSDDGVLKIWTSDLNKICEVNTNCSGILSIAVGETAIYTCTADETIKSWDKHSLKNLATLKSSLCVPQKVFYETSSGTLWAGDSKGRVSRFENNVEVVRFELTEEIWDLYVTTNPTLVITSRDRDAVVFEIVKGEVRSNAVVKATMQGRYPLTLVKDVLCCLDREGRKIQVHENSVVSKFQLLREIPAATMIVNALCPGEDATIYAGGYDQVVSLWDTTTGESKGSLSVGSCVNALTPADHGAYVALANGKIVQISS